MENNQVYVGLITDLGYSNTNIEPFEEFQRFKLHPETKKYLEGGKRVSYGARAITKGGYNSLPKMTFPGGLLLGCDAGTLNFSKIKGAHTAMKTGMIAAEAVFEALKNGSEGKDELTSYTTKFENSWLYKELFNVRNFGPAMHKFGNVYEDSSMGVVFTSLFALGVIIISQAASQVDLDAGCVLYGLIQMVTIDTTSRPQSERRSAI